MFNTSETLKDLEVPEGRRLLHDFYHDRRIKHVLEIRTMLDCWRLCRRGTEIQFSDGRRVRFETNLGMKLGTRVFMEEIVSRYYSNLIHGSVYFGAMILLIAVGFYLAGYSFWIAFAAFLLEALFLLFLAVVTAYAPVSDSGPASSAIGLNENLLTSINNTVREMTNAVSDLFRLISQSDIRQDVLLTRLTEHLSKINADNIRQYSRELEKTNQILTGFSESYLSIQEDITRMQSDLLIETKKLRNILDHGMKTSDSINTVRQLDRGSVEFPHNAEGKPE